MRDSHLDGVNGVERARLRTWAEVGGRVAVARERAGFTQGQLADRLGLHRSAVTRIELGQRQLDALELAGIAETLGRPVSWFLTQPPAAIASHRDGLSAEADAVLLEERIEQAARDVVLLTELDVLSAPPARLQAGVTSLAQAEAGAAQARALLGLGDGPLHDLQSAVERLGLFGFSFDLGPAEIDGGYVRLGDTGVAVVNGAADPGRRRFNLAHELGHHLLADEYTVEFGLRSSGRADREALINAFAIHFLMPGHPVRARWRDLATTYGDARRRLILLAAEYRVSWSAVLGQAVNLGLIPRHQLRLLEMRRPTPADYIETGVRFEEELQPIALPLGYSKAAIRAFREGFISADRAVELLHGAVTVDDLPRPNELTADDLRPEFQDIDGS